MSMAYLCGGQAQAVQADSSCILDVLQRQPAPAQIQTLPEPVLDCATPHLTMGTLVSSGSKNTDLVHILSCKWVVMHAPA